MFKKNPVYKIAKQAKMLKSKVILQNIFFYETYSTACIPHYNPPKSGLSLRVQKIYKDFATMKQKTQKLNLSANFSEYLRIFEIIRWLLTENDVY